jgi:hypothetical protein
MTSNDDIIINSIREIYVTDQVLMSRGRDLRKIPQINKAELYVKPQNDIRLWTDDYSNLVQILR